MILRTNDALANPLLRYVFGGEAIAQIDVILQSSWPESGIDCSWPAMRSMKEGRTGSLSDKLDTVLGPPILMVSVDATKGKGLTRCFDRRFEELGIEQAVVRMIMMGGDAMGTQNAFKSLFRCDSGSGVHLSHQVDISEVAKMIDENSRANVAHKRRSSPMSGYEAGSRTDELINADHLTGCSSDLDFAAILMFVGFAAPRPAMGLAIGTAWTGGRVHIGEVAWK